MKEKTWKEFYAHPKYLNSASEQTVGGVTDGLEPMIHVKVDGNKVTKPKITYFQKISTKI